jgi:predicted O-methyltransferase YrrM
MMTDTLPYGWFTAQEASLYAEEAEKVRAGVVVEVGVYLGRSLSVVAPVCRRNSTRLVAVDNWKGCVEIGEEKLDLRLLDGFRENMAWLGLTGAIEEMEGDSAASAANFADGSVDLVFLDATHYYITVKADAKAWWPKIRAGGVLLGHDYQASYPGLVKAVNELFGQPDERRGTVWKVTKTSAGRMRGTDPRAGVRRG